MEERTQCGDQIDMLQAQLVQDGEKISDCRRRDDYLRRCYESELSLDYVEIPEEIKKKSEKVYAFLAADCRDLQKDTIIRDLNKVYFENRGYLVDYQLTQTELFGELDSQAKPGDPTAKRLDIQTRYQGVRLPFHKLLTHLEEDIEEFRELIRAGDRELFEDILANTVSRKIRGKINSSNTWVTKMNTLMGAMNTSSGLKLSLR